MRNEKEKNGFQSIHQKKKKKGKKSTGLIFISADLGMLSSGIFWYGTQLTPIESGRGFIIKVKTVEILMREK